jgi:hypothetical protein
MATKAKMKRDANVKNTAKLKRMRRARIAGVVRLAQLHKELVKK